MNEAVKLDCRNMWKLFGAGAEGFLKANPLPSLEQIRAAGLIGAVRDASVAVAEGEIFVIMGLSGSGKSTLVRLMARLIEPTAGQLMFEGQDLMACPERELIRIRRQKMGMVFQHFALLPHLTVLENVAFPLEIQGVGREQREKRAREVIQLVGLEGRERYHPRELSGGQQQRVGIARSLAVEPDLWFLDEPFSALDPLIRREMQDEFLRLQELLHKTIIFITHDFDEAIRLADRIAIMADGAIIQVATPEELVLNPATPYVEDFTRHIPRAKVLTAGSLARPGEANGTAGVAATDRIDAIADRVVSADGPVPVLGEDGRPVGVIDRAAVIDVLVGRELRR